MKIFKKILVTFIFFISFITIVQAKGAHATVTVPIWNAANSKINLSKDSVIVGLKCRKDSKSTEYKNIDTQGIEYSTPSGNITLANSSGTIIIRTGSNFNSKNNETIVLDGLCTYEEIAHEDEFLKNIDVEEEDRLDGNLTIKLQPFGNKNKASEIIVKLYPLLGDDSQIIIGKSGFFGEEVMKDLKKSGIDIPKASKDYITVSKKTNSLSVSLKEKAKNIKEDKTYTFTLNMHSSTGNYDYTIIVDVKVIGTVPIYALAAPSCDFNSSWKPVSVYVGTDFFSKYKAYYDSENINVTLPTCVNQGDERYEFSGWVYETAVNGGTLTSSSSVCKPTIQGGQTVNMKQIRSQVNSRSKGAFVACYSQKQQVTLSLTRGKINNTDNKWSVNEEGEMYSEYYYLLSDSEELTFPEIIRTYDNANEESTPTGWSAAISDDRCVGDIMAPGSKIPGAGEYYACYDKEEVIEDGEIVTDTRRDRLEIILGQEYDFSSEYIPTGDVNYVDTANNYIQITKDGSRTIIKGIKKTEKPIMISVTGNYRNKGTITIYYEITVVPDSIEVLDLQYDGEGNIISTTGETYDVFGYLDTAEEVDPSCKKFKVEELDRTANVKGIKIAKSTTRSFQGSHVELMAHLFTVTLECEGQKKSYQGVCLDPGRDEPKSNSYYKDPDMDPSTDAADRVTAYIRSKKPKENMNDNELAAATFALRLVAILSGDDLNNKSSGLKNYYYAYKDIANNIRSLAGVGDNEAVSLSKLSKWKDKSALKNASNDKFFCTARSKVCVLQNQTIASLAKDYILNGLAYEPSQGITAKVGITKTDVVWDGDSKKYIKYIDGTIEGIKENINAMFSIEAACPSCAKVGANTKLYIGRDTNHLVRYHQRVDYFKVQYKDYAQSDWYPGQYTSAYDNEKLLNNGVLYFRYVITINSDKLRANAGGSVSTYNPNSSSFSSSGKDYGVYLSLGDNSQTYRIDTGVALPATSVNLQRIVLFSPGTIGTTYPTNGRTGDGSGGRTPPTIFSTPPTSIAFDYNPGSGPSTYRVSYTTVKTSTILPTCDLNKPIFNYDDKSTFNAYLFREAGCCAYVLNENTELYKKVCKVTCTFQSYSPVCKVNKNGGAEVQTENLAVHEGMQKDENGNETGNMTCVYVNKSKAEVGKERMNNIKRTDVAGNTYMIKAYEDNSICNVYCKEDWDFTLPSLHSHTGKNYVIAGQYFEINYKEIGIKGKRTCVTSYIDISAWRSKLCNLSTAMVAAFNAAQFNDGGAHIKNEFNQGLGMAGVTYGDVKITKKEATKCKKAKSYNKKGSVQGINITPEGDQCKLTYKKWVETGDRCGSCDSGHDIACTKSDGTSGCKHTDYGWSDDEYTTLKKATECKYTFEREVQYTVSNMSYNCSSGVVVTPATITGVGTRTTPTPYPGECSDSAIPLDTFNEDATQLRLATIDDGIKNGVAAKGGATNWQGYKSEIKKIIEDMNQCQRFELTTEDKQGTITPNGGVGTNTDITTTIQEILTVFDPKISFTYDEPEYMSKIGTNNQLEMVGKPEYEERYYFYLKNGFNPITYKGTKGESGVGHQQVTMLGDSSAPAAYCTAGGSGTGRTGGTKETVGHVYHWSSEPDCYEIDPDYFQNGWYIKRTLSYKADFQKSHNWYTDSKSEFKEYAKTIQEAVNNSRSNNKDLKSWSIYGSSDPRNLVFPVSKRTPRNIYKYTFTYSNIGMYNNNVTTGRIMGGSRSVISNNKRVCFYEVIESICYCCGDMVSYSIIAQDTGNMIKSFNDSDTSNVAYSYYNKNTGKGGIYGLNYDRIKKCTEGSKKCDIDSSENSVSNLIVSNVSLGSVEENLGRVIGVNWGGTSHYNIEGNYYITDKGVKLLNHVDGGGETIYEKMPEYSYTISPSVMAEIRKINSEEGYQPKTETLDAIGRVKLTNKDNNKNWSTDAEEVGYYHFTSKFLREIMSKFVTEGVNPITESDDICYVKAEEFNPTGETDTDFGQVYGSNNNKKKFIQNGHYNCRFIDYVGTVTPHDASKPTNENIGKYYRLSFK